MIVLVPGFLQAPDDLAPLGEALVGLGLPESRVDLLELTSGSTWSEAARRLSERVSSSIAPVFLVGYSMGARLALAVATCAPSQLAGLVLLSGSPGLEDESARSARRALDEERAQALLRDAEGFLSSWEQLPMFAPFRATPAFRALAKERRLHIRDERAAAWVHVLRALSPGAMPSLWPSLGALEVPTLLLAGALDEAYVDIAARARALLPNSRVGVLPGVGHVLPLEAPDEVARRIAAFLVDGAERGQFTAGVEGVKTPPPNQSLPQESQ